MNINTHILSIKQTCGEKTKISRPALPGFIHPIYIAETNKAKTVFRFSTPERATRNVVVSRVLRNHGFNVPNVHIKVLNGEYCEMYPFMNGKTLYERYIEGISPEAVHRIYKQLFDITMSLTEIHPYEIDTSFDGYVERGFKIIHTYFRLINMTPPKICHDDLHDKNFLLDNQDNVCAILDLDAVKKCSLECSMVRMMKFAEPYGYTLNDIEKFLPHIYHGKLLNLDKQFKIYTNLQEIYRYVHRILLGTQQIIAKSVHTM